MDNVDLIDDVDDPTDPTDEHVNALEVQIKNTDSSLPTANH